MTALMEREQWVQWIDEAVQAGARFASLPPSQIDPRLADEGVYLASESSFYRVLHAADQLHHRGRACCPVKRVATTHVAHAPNLVWCWDITYLPAAIRGDFYYLYLMLAALAHPALAAFVHPSTSFIQPENCWLGSLRRRKRRKRQRVIEAQLFGRMHCPTT